MADATTTPVIDLEAEATSAPVRADLPYRQVGTACESVGGASVFLSRNRKAVEKLGEKAPVFLTSQEGTQQQSIPFRAIAAALTHDVIPMSQVVTRYLKAGRLEELRSLVPAPEAPTPAPDLEAEAPAPTPAPAPEKAEKAPPKK